MRRLAPVVALATSLVFSVACHDSPPDCPKYDGEGNPSVFEILCDGQCISVFGDPLNCGGCGVRCAADRACCGARCVDLQVGVGGEDCGACGTRCLDPATCSAGACTCPATLTLCAEPIGGRQWCANLQTGESPFRDCGACGHRCAASQVCSAGICTP